MPALRTHHRCPHPRPQLVPGPRFMSSLGDEPQYSNLSKPHLNASAAPLHLKCPPLVTPSSSNSVSTQLPNRKTESSLWWLRGVPWVRLNFIPQNSLSSVFAVNTGSKQESLLRAGGFCREAPPSGSLHIGTHSQLFNTCHQAAAKRYCRWHQSP